MVRVIAAASGGADGRTLHLNPRKVVFRLPGGKQKKVEVKGLISGPKGEPIIGTLIKPFGRETPCPCPYPSGLGPADLEERWQQISRNRSTEMGCVLQVKAGLELELRVEEAIKLE